MTVRPPAIPGWLLSRLLDADTHEAVAGDLEEEFSRRQAERGSPAARRWYWSAAIRSIVSCRITGQRRVERRRMDFDTGRVSARDLLKPAFRPFRDHPVYACATVGTLALAIGVGAVTMTVVKRAYLDPLPYRDDARLHSLLTSINGNTSAVSAFVVDDLRRTSSPFTGIAGVRPFSWSHDTGEYIESLPTNLVTPDYFSVLGVRPAMGRVWTSGEPDAIVISWNLWTTTLGSDPDALSRSIVLDGRPRTIVGVMPREFIAPYWPNVSIWAPLEMSTVLTGPRSVRALSVFARRSDQATDADVAAFLAVFSRTLQLQHPTVHGNQSWVAPTVREELVGPARPAVLGAGAAALLLLLIVAANIAGLSTAHAAATRHQTAIRSALGATRARLFAEQLAETLVLTLMGSAIGIAIAFGLTGVVAQYQQQFLGRLLPIELDATTTLVALIAGMAIGVVASVVPRRLVGAQPSDALRTSRGGSVDRRLTRTRTGLVMAQVAIALVLLVGAGLLIRTVRHLSTMSLGFAADNLVVANLNLPLPRYRTPESQLQFEQQIVERVSHLHGVRAATASVGFPVVGGMMAGLTLKNSADVAPSEIAYLSVAPNFMSQLGATMLEGRDLLTSDTRTAPRVVIINETMARGFWPGGNAIGSEVYIGPGTPDQWITVVGVVADIRTHGPTEVIRPTAFGSTWQYSWPRRHITVRTDGEPRASLAADLRAAIREVDPTIPTSLITTVDGMLAERTGRHRLASLALTLFGSLALVLCASGLYAVVALTSRLRQREYAIRIALGARASEVRWLVFKHALVIGGVGTAMGLAAAISGTRILDGLLHGVSAVDQPVFAAAVASLLVLAAIAAWQPARQAARVDPIETLKGE